MSRRSRHGRRPQQSTPQAESPDLVEERAPAPPVEAGPPTPRPEPGDVAVSTAVQPAPAAAALATAEGEAPARETADVDAARTTCTQAQLRRFIKSRPWIPMHELRRRFGIFGADDEVTPVRVGNGTVFVGLPGPEGRMLGELLNAGDVGFELSLDPGAPIVVGVYPMRPVPRG